MKDLTIHQKSIINAAIHDSMTMLSKEDSKNEALKRIISRAAYDALVFHNEHKSLTLSKLTNMVIKDLTSETETKTVSDDIYLIIKMTINNVLNYLGK